MVQGSRVEAGQVLVEADLAAIAQAGHPDTVIVVITNSREVSSVSIIAHAGAEVSAGAPVLTVTR